MAQLLSSNYNVHKTKKEIDISAFLTSNRWSFLLLRILLLTIFTITINRVITPLDTYIFPVY